VRFREAIKVTIEHGHANHLANEMSSVAYWYADWPAAVLTPPLVDQRRPVPRDNQGRWLYDPTMQTPSRQVVMTDEAKKRKTEFGGSDRQ
jgi:hypothetical protein